MKYIAALAEILWRVYELLKKRKLENDLQNAQDDPAGSFADHFGGMQQPTATTETETGPVDEHPGRDMPGPGGHGQTDGIHHQTGGTIMDWTKWPNFSKHEFDCKETGENCMDASFMDRLQSLRTEYGKPMTITSGYRSPSHSIEAKKANPGAHSTGHACDISCYRGDAYALLSLAFKHGFTGIGVNQKGGGRFIHLDDLKSGDELRPTIWSY